VKNVAGFAGICLTGQGKAADWFSGKLSFRVIRGGIRRVIRTGIPRRIRVVRRIFFHEVICRIQRVIPKFNRFQESDPRPQVYHAVLYMISGFLADNQAFIDFLTAFYFYGSILGIMFYNKIIAFVGKIVILV
jgi:hypothetical protein